jgi:CHASE2 domain-containing sensor protein
VTRSEQNPVVERHPPTSAEWRERLTKYREQLLQAALLTIPLATVGRVNEAVSSRLFTQPWQAIWILVPLAIAVLLLRQRVVRLGTLSPDRRLLAFLGTYVLLFTAASQTSVLDISRELTAFGTPVSRRWVTPVSWGDWRYRLVPRLPDPRDELVVVQLASGAGRPIVEGRKELIDLIAIAAKSGARGVALDVYFTESSPIDPLLCRVITTAGIPVIVGFGFERRQGRIVEMGIPETLQPCLTEERVAHLAGLLDFDLVSRATPLFFRSDPGRPALGLAVARSLAGKEPLDLPPDGVLRFVPPLEDPLTVRFDELTAGTVDRNFLRNRFVMAGEAEQDSFNTVSGRKPGIVIHSYVVHSLRQAHDIRYHAWWLGFAIMLVFCYWMTIWCANGVNVRMLVALCVFATLVVVGTAIVSILVGPYWLDVVYPVTAIWLLLPMLAGFRRVILRQPVPVLAEAASAAD